MKRYTKAQRTADFYTRMEAMGFTWDEIETLRRAQMTLHRWAERECNGEIERMELERNNRPFRRSYSGKVSYVPDLETGAWKRVLATVEARNGRQECGDEPKDTQPDALIAYHQTDPRGCALYLVKKSDLGGHDISAVYNRGFGVCIG